MAMPALQPGDSLEIIAPSGPSDPKKFAAGLELLHTRGLRVRAGGEVLARQGYLAGTDSQRLATVRRALAEAKVSILWAARGGYGALRIASQLSQLAPPPQPRWLVGFSDITVLHQLWHRWGWLSVHGPNVTTLAEWGQSQRGSLWSLLAGDGGVELPVDHLCGPTRTVTGPLLGGNLAVLASMVGTGLLPSLKGAVLLLEEIGERPYRLDRLLTQLRLAGCLEGVTGVIIGQLTGCEERGHPVDAPTALEVCRGCLEDLEVPVVSGAPIGHQPDAWPALLGWPVTVDPMVGRIFQQPWRS